MVPPVPRMTVQIPIIAPVESFFFSSVAIGAGAGAGPGVPCDTPVMVNVTP